MYASILTKPQSEKWLAQNYADSLKAYDYVVIMAYPRMEEVVFSASWLKRLVLEAKKYPDGLRKTVFKVQTYNWQNERWIGTNTVLGWLRVLVASGAQHIAYYPDNYIEDQPEAKTIRLMMSTEDFAFKRKYTEADFLK